LKFLVTPLVVTIAMSVGRSVGRSFGTTEENRMRGAHSRLQAGEHIEPYARLLLSFITPTTTQPAFYNVQHDQPYCCIQNLCDDSLGPYTLATVLRRLYAVFDCLLYLCLQPVACRSNLLTS